MTRSFVTVDAEVVVSQRNSRTLAFNWPNEAFIRQIPLRGKTFRTFQEGVPLNAEIQRTGPDEFNLLSLVSADEDGDTPPFDLDGDTLVID